MIHSANQRFDDSFQLQPEEQGTYAVNGNIGLYYQRVDVLVVTAQYLDNAGFLFRQFREKIALDALGLLSSGVPSPIHSLYKIGGIVYQCCFVVSNQLIASA